MSSYVYGATSLIGGVAGSVDNIDGAALADKDALRAAVQDVGIYEYVLDASSGAAESSPDIISPDTNAGTKRWILKGITRIPNGATIPTDPKAGEVFLHTPTGRSILLAYNGTNWKPIQSVGSMTIYVHKTLGTDSIEKGTASYGSAYKTIQYAIDSIPGTVGGNVIININGETYTEDITIQGKNYTGNYTITLQGTLSVSVGPNAQDSSVQGTGATQGSITDTGAFTGQAHKLLYSSNNAEYRLIDSVTANTGTIAGCWTAAPTGNYTIYDWATVITGKTTIATAQTGIYFYDIKFTNSGGNNICLHNMFSEVFYYRCHFGGSVSTTMILTYGLHLYDTCILDSTGTTSGIIMQLAPPQKGNFNRSKIEGAGGSRNGMRVQGGFLSYSKGSIIDNCDLSTGGLFVETNAVVQAYSAVSDGNGRIRNCTLGIYATQGGQVSNTASLSYSGNTTDETSVAASYGYID